MWELIKNDPILKTISVLILGMFAFAFAFSIMFGTGQSSMEHSMSSGGYNLATSLGHVITLLSKILIIVLLVAVIITAIKFIQKHIVANEPIKFADKLKTKSFASILAVIGGLLVLLLLISMVLPSSSSTMMYGTTKYGVNNMGFGITGVLVAILHIIALISFGGLILGLVMYFRERYATSQKTVVASAKVNCSQCGNELKAHWKCCPSCGQEVKEGMKATTKDNEEN